MIECTLPGDINNCQFYDEKNKSCNNQNYSQCSFSKSIDPQNKSVGYVREERWYEKYYK